MGTDTAVKILESELVPYHLSSPPGERVVVFAPHPDDETLGCGGTIGLLAGMKKKVKVLFLTSGDKGGPALADTLPGRSGEAGGTHLTDYALMREGEAERALRVLGVSEYEFLRFPDRGIHEHYQDALKRLLEGVESFGAETIYSPSMVELNPDHRATAALSMEIQRTSMRSSSEGGCQVPVRIVFYEVTTPLRPNTLVDIDSVYRRKKRALKKYRSQLKYTDYLGHITALNTMRALTVSGPRYVEAFWCVETPLGSQEIADWLSYRGMLTAGY